MNERVYLAFIIFLLFVSVLIFFGMPLSSSQENTSASMKISANFFNFGDIIGIEVPYLLDFGNISKSSPVSDKLKVYVNNTGNVAINIYPFLTNASDPLFRYTYVQLRQTGANSNISEVGMFNLSISKPASGSKENEYFWIWLDLTNFSGNVDGDKLNYSSGVIFWAFPQ